eukprot:scaffold96687_cov14-Tisochrysis_lutea.AAC.1
MRSGNGMGSFSTKHLEVLSINKIADTTFLVDAAGCCSKIAYMCFIMCGSSGSGHSGQWGTTAELFLPSYAYRDLAGNFGIQDADLDMYVGPSSYIDNDLGKVSSITVACQEGLLRCCHTVHL